MPLGLGIWDGMPCGDRGGDWGARGGEGGMRSSSRRARLALGLPSSSDPARPSRSLASAFSATPADLRGGSTKWFELRTSGPFAIVLRVEPTGHVDRVLAPLTERCDLGLAEVGLLFFRHLSTTRSETRIT